MGFFGGDPLEEPGALHTGEGSQGLFGEKGDEFDILGLGVSGFDDLRAFSGASGAEAALEGARLQQQAALAGIEEQRRQFDYLQSLQQPFFDVGVNQLPLLARGASVGGLDANLQALRDSGALTTGRGSAVSDQLSATGLNGMGFGGRGLSEVSTSQLMGLENLLNQRRQGLAGVSQTAGTNIGRAGASTGQGIAQLLQQAGAAQAAGGLGAAQSMAQGGQNLASVIGGLSNFTQQPRNDGRGRVFSNGGA